MDEFAQTRGVDELFDDDIMPPTPEQAAQYTQYHFLESSYPQPSEAPPVRASNGGQNRKRRGRGPRENLYTRGRKSGGNENKKEDNNSSNTNSGITEVVPKPETDEVAKDNPEKETETTLTKTENTVENEDSKPKDAAKPKVAAVRGDRSGTGGVKKPKLTEEELSERMAAVKLAAAKRAEAHKRAEADEADFNERERIANERREKERQNHRVMVGERERNRQRKLQAQTGREWDADKSPDTFGDRGRGGSAYRRGVHGGVIGERGTENPPAILNDEVDQPPIIDGYRGRGNRSPRGGRGRGFGRGRGRGGRGYFNGDTAPAESIANRPSDAAPPSINAESEFPSLPTESTSGSTAIAVDTKQPAELSDLASPAPLQGSWADHVDELQKAEAEKEAQPT